MLGRQREAGKTCTYCVFMVERKSSISGFNKTLKLVLIKSKMQANNIVLMTNYRVSCILIKVTQNCTCTIWCWSLVPK